MLVAHGATQSHSQDTDQLVIACNMVVQATEGLLGNETRVTKPSQAMHTKLTLHFINPAGLED